MDPLLNPYTPNAGAKPDALVGRDAQLQSFTMLLRRLSRGRSEQSMIITGLRGVGKTVLLGQFRSEALREDWVVVELEASKHDDDSFRRDIASRVRTALFELSPRKRWGDRAERAAAVLKAFTLTVDPMGGLSAGLDIDAAFGAGDHRDLTLDLTDLLIAVGEAAREVKRGVILLIDEVQFLDRRQLEAVIQALHKVVQQELPLTMVGAGLPQIAETAGDAKSYAERLFKFPTIGNLESADAAEAFARPAENEGVHYAKEAVERAVDLTGGYPYFIQELGYAVWTTAQTSPITLDALEEAVPVYESKLDSSFFRVRLDRATELQRAYLRAMAELGPAPQKAQDVAAVLDRQSKELGPTRAELIRMGLLYTPEHGYAAFTVPHFDSFMKRAMPAIIKPELRRRARRKQPSED